jgi:hypothetical protein
MSFVMPGQAKQNNKTTLKTTLKTKKGGFVMPTQSEEEIQMYRDRGAAAKKDMLIQNKTLPKSTPPTPKPIDYFKKNQDMLDFMNKPLPKVIPKVDNDVPYIKTFKEVPKNFMNGNVASGIGNTLKGTGQMALEGIQAPQKLVLNASKAIINKVQGRDVKFDPNISVDSYLKDTGNADTEKFYNTTGGKVVSGVLGITSDPLTWVGGGLASDVAKAGATGTKGLINSAETGLKVSNKLLDSPIARSLNDKLTTLPKGGIKPNLAAKETALTVNRYDAPSAPVNKALSQSNKSNVNTPSLPKELPNVGNKNVAANIDNGNSMLNVPVGKEIKGIDPTIGEARDFTIRSSSERGTPKSKFESFYSKIVDTNAPLKRIGDSTLIKATNAKKTGGTVDYILKEGLTDAKGNTIGKSLKQINDSIPKNKENDFWQYMLHKLNPQRAAQEKRLGDVSVNFSASRVAELEAANPQFKQVSGEIRNFIDNFMNEWGVKTGLVSKESMAEMRTMYPDYIPAQRFFDEIEKSSGGMGKRSFVDQTSNIKGAKGSDRDIIDPLENIMNMVNKTVRSAKFNEVGQSLLDAVRKNPKVSEIAEIVPIQEGMFTNLDNVVSVLEDGKPIYLKVHDKSVLDALNQINSPDLQDWQQAAKKVTGVFKSLITTKNPLFAVRNMFRDIPTSYIYGSTANPFKFTKDLGAAAIDVGKNSKAYKQYKALGGQGGNFFNSGDVGKTASRISKGSNVFQKIGDGIEWFNNLSESAPRLAEFKRTLAKTGDANKALFQAGEVTTNFSRGGNVTKQIDSFTPYLNAGVQGLDRMLRSLDPRNPMQMAKTLIKSGIAITIPTVAIEYMNKDNKNYQELDNRTKDTYFCIPNGDTFIKIPKSREFGVIFSSLFQRLDRMVKGDDKAFKGFGSSVATSFAPANPFENNIGSAAMGLSTNEDFAGRDIVPQSMKTLPNRLQRDEKTSSIATGFTDALYKASGGIIELSPKQVNYLIDSYTGIIGDVAIPATTQVGGTGSKNLLNKLASPVKSAFTVDPLYSNQTVTDFYDNMDEITKIANAKNIDEGLPSKLLTKEEQAKGKFTKASKQLTDINKKIKELSIVGTEYSKNQIKLLRQEYLNIAKTTNDYYKSIK